MQWSDVEYPFGATSDELHRNGDCNPGDCRYCDREEEE